MLKKHSMPLYILILRRIRTTGLVTGKKLLLFCFCISYGHTFKRKCYICGKISRILNNTQDFPWFCEWAGLPCALTGVLRRHFTCWLLKHFVMLVEVLYRDITYTASLLPTSQPALKTLLASLSTHRKDWTDSRLPE